MNAFEHATTQLHDLGPGITLAILHPDFHGQHRLFAPLLHEASSTTIFTAVPQPDCSLGDLLSYMKTALEEQMDAADPPALPDKAESAASQLAAYLNQHSRINLILDNFDLTHQEQTVPFIAALARQLHGGNRLILGARELPMALLHHDDLQDRIALVPVEPDKMLLDYVATAGKNVLEVRALGPGRVLINGQLINHWDGVLPRTLFFYFVDRGMTTRDEIFQTFWPNLSTREATNVFHVTKRKISEILGTDLTVYWSGFYRISPDLELHYDVVKFAEAVQNAAVANEQEGVQLLQNAISLYHGPFLSTMNQKWVESRREELAMSYAEALAGLARIYQRRDAKFSALGYFLRAAATNPQREDLARSIMELYYELGRTEEALNTYARLEEELQATLNVMPGPQTVDLANEIRATR